MMKSKFLKCMVVFSVLFSTFIPISEMVVNAFAEDSKEGLKPDMKLANPGDYLYDPSQIDRTQDGYAYAKPNKITDPTTGETMYQMWAYAYGHTDRGWTGYVGENSRTLLMVGDINNHLTLGVGFTGASTNYTYKAAVFDNTGYKGNILSVQGAETGSALLTSTGEIWYTGSNVDNRFGSEANNRTGIQNNIWMKMDLSNLDGKVVDMALMGDAMTVVTDTGKLYFQGRQAFSDPAASNPVYNYYDGYFVAGKGFDKAVENDFRAYPLPNGETATRLFSQELTEDNINHERWFIVETSGGYYGAAYRVQERKAAGTGTDGLDTNPARGLNPVMMQAKGGNVVKVPAGFAKDIVAIGEEFVAHLIGTDGKIYTSGYSLYGNVAGTQYTYFRGWDNWASNLSIPSILDTQVITSAILNRWNTNHFAENDIWGSDNKEVYPGVLTTYVRKNDGTLYHVSEFGAAGGSVPSEDSSSGGLDGYACLNSTAWCYHNSPKDYENFDSYYFNSTTWDKSEIMKRDYIIGLWNGAFAVDQDGFLRSAPRTRNYEELAVSQAIFPQVIDGVSTIRTTESYPNVSNIDYISRYSDNRNESYRTNARVVGEFLLYGSINVVAPTFSFDGDGTTADYENSVMPGRVAGTDNPFNLEIGPTYSRSYTTNSDGSNSVNAKFYVNYDISTYDVNTGEIGTYPVISGDDVDITDSNVNVDLSALNPGWYEIHATRETSDEKGVVYESSTSYEYFYVSDELTMEVDTPLFIDENDTFPINIASNNTAVIRPNTNLKDSMYIINTSDNFANLGTVITKSVPVEGGSETKPVDVSVAGVTNDNVGVYMVEYAVYYNGVTTTEKQVVVVDDSTLVINNNAVLKADNFMIDISELNSFNPITKANSSGWDLSDGSEVTPVVNATQLNTIRTSGEVGTYALKYTVSVGADTAEKTIYVTVTDSDTIMNGNVALKASNFTIDVADVSTVDVKSEASAKAWKLSDGSSLNITLNSAHVAVLQAATEAGVYPVELSTTDGITPVTKTIYVTVTDSDTAINSDVALRASNFTIDVADVSTVDVKSKANAKAWKLSDGSTLNLIVDSTHETALKSATEAGVYPVALSTTDSITVATRTIYASVIDSDTVIKDDVALSANNFTIDLANVSTVDVKAKSNAKSWKLSDGSSLTVTPKTSEVNALKGATSVGVYPISLSSTDSTTTVEKIVYASVVDENTVINGNVAISANNFTVDVANVSTVNVIIESSAKAWKLNDILDLTITYSDTSEVDILKAATEAGVYAIRLKASDGNDIAEKTIYVTVIDSNTVTEGDIALKANSFAISVSEVSTVNVLNETNAEAWKLSDGSSLIITLNNGQVDTLKAATKAGVYPVALSTTDSTSTVTKTIYATVTDTTTVVNGDAVLSAESFTIDVGSVSTVDVIASSNAAAWKLSDGSSLTVLANTNQVDVLKAATKAGIYPVALSATANGDTALKTIYVTVTDSNTVINGNVVLVANNFAININDLDNINVIDNASAQAWNKLTGQDLTVTYVNASQVDTIKAATTGGVYPVALSATDHSTNATKTIYVTVVDNNTTISGNVALKANNFIINVNEVSTVDINARSNATAWKLDDGSSLTVIADVTQANALKAATEAGVYPVALSATDTTDTVEKTIYATVIDNDTVIKGNVALSANNFITDLTNVSTIDVIINSSAKAWKLDDGSSLSVIADITQVNALKAATTPGVYPVKLSATDTNDTAEKIVYVTVTNSDTIINGNTALYAKNFTIDVSSASTVDVITSSSAKAWQLNNGHKLIVNYKDTTEVDALKAAMSGGVYPVTLTATDSIDTVERTIYVTVTDSETIIDEDIALKASDFQINLANVSTVNVITSANVQAWKLSDGSSLTPTVNSSDLNAIKSATSVGIFPTRITVIDGSKVVEKTIYVSVVDDNTVVEGNVALSAKNFTININDLSTVDVITNSNAKAWQLNSGTNLTPVAKSSDITALKAVTIAGAYPVEISATSSSDTAVKKIYVTVTDNDTIIEGNVGLRANNFTINVSEAANVDILSKANAKAWSIATGNNLTVTFMNSTEVDAIKSATSAGVYSVQLTATDLINTVEKTIYVTVIDSDTVIEEDLALNASNFTIDVSSVSTVDVISSSNAYAWKLSNGVMLPVLVNNVQETALKAAASAGVYPVTLSATDSTDTAEKIIYATVTDSDTVVSGNVAISANDITINLSEASTIEIISETAAKAWRLDNGGSLNVTANTTDLNALKAATESGVFSVKLTATDGVDIAEQIVYVTVVDSNTVVEGNVALSAKNFTIDISEVSTVDILNNGNVKAKSWTLDQGTDLTVTYVDTNQVDSLKAATTGGVYPITLSATDAGDTAVKTIYVTVIDVDTVINGDVAIYASNFTVDVSNVSDVNVLSKSAAKAWKLSDGSSLTVTVNSTQEDALKAATSAGTYQVTLSASDSITTATREITVTVVDSLTVINGNVALSAADFEIDLDVVSTVDVIASSSAKAWRLDDGNTLSVTANTLEVNTLKAATEAGVYPITLSATDGVDTATKIIYVTVADENTVINGNVALYGQSFVVDINDVSTVDVITSSNSKAWKLNDGTTLSVTANTTEVNTLKAATEAGVYPITLSATDGVDTATKTIYATVTDSNTVINGNVVLTASNFTIAVSSVSTVNVLNESNAKAWNKDSGNSLTTKIVNTTQLNALKAATEAGVYPIALSATDGTTMAEKTIYVTVTDANTVIVGDVALSAKNFTIDVSNVSTVNVVNNSSAAAWKLSDGSSLTVTSDTIQTNLLKAATEAGVFPVTLSATDGSNTSEKIIYATVTDNNTEINGDVALRASNFTIDVSSVNTVNVVSNSSAAAWKLSDGSSLTPTVDAAQESALKTATLGGAYPVTLSATDGTTTATKTIYVTVTDSNTVISGNAALRASNFTIDVNSVSTVNIINSSNASAWRLDNGSSLTVLVNSAQETALKSATKAGVYAVDLSATTSSDKVVKTIYVTVTDANTVINGDVALTANNFTVDVNDVSTVNIVTNANAKAWKLSDGSSLTVTVDNTEENNLRLATSGGVYPITLSVTDGITTATKVIYVTVTDTDTVINGNIALTANNFTVDVNDVSTVNIINSSNASAWKLDDGSSLTVLVNSAQETALKSATKAGVYAVDLSATSSSETVVKTIYVTVTDDNTVINGNVALSANNFTISINDLETIDILTESSAKAWRLDNGKSIIVKTAIASQVSALESAMSGGVYPITLSSTDGVDTATKIIYVTVTDDNTVINGNVALIANNFIVDLANVSTINIVTSASASAWKLDDGSSLTPTPDSTQETALKTATSVGVYPVTLSVSDGTTTVTKTIYVTVTDSNTVINTNVALTATNFTINVNDVSTVDVISNSNASAWKLDDGSSLTVLANSTQVDSLKAATSGGVYPVKLSTTDGIDTVEKTIYISVTDDDTGINGNVALTASNFTIDVSNVSTVNVLTEANARAWKLSDGANLTITYVDSGQIDELKAATSGGVYPVTLSASNNGDTVTKTIYVTVTDVETVIVGDVAIRANSFSIDLANVSTVNVTDSSSAKAWKLSDGSSLTVIENTAQVNILKAATSGGVYPIILSTTDGIDTASKTIYVTVKDEYTVESGKVAISAKNFTIDVSEVGTVDVILSADARAWREDSGAGVIIRYVDPSEVFALQDATEAGVYPVRLRATLGEDTVVKTVYVTVIDEHTVVNDSLAITAKNVIVNLADVSGVNVLNESEVRAWSLDNGTDLTVTYGDSTQVDKIHKTLEVGVYPVSLTAKTQTSSIEKTVYVSVIDEETVKNGDVLITGYDLVVNLNDISSLDILNESNAKAWTANEGTILQVVVDSVDQSNLNSATEAGVYPVKLSATDGTTTATKTIYVSVITEDSVLGTSIALNAKNFTISLAQASSVNVITESSAKAWNLSTGDSLEIKVDNLQLNVLQAATEAGVYAVSLNTTNGTETIIKTVYVSVIDGETVNANDLFLRAESFILDYNEIESLDENVLINKASVIGWHGNNNPITTSLSASSNNILNKSFLYSELESGNYEQLVTFEVTDGSEVLSRTVKMTISRKVLRGNNAAIHIDDTQDVSLQEVLNVYVEDYYVGEKTSQSVEISMSDAEVANLGTGVYEIILTSNQETKKVYLTVYDDLSVLNDEYIILAKKIVRTYSESELKTLTLEKILVDYGLESYSMITGNSQSIYIKDLIDLDEINKAELNRYELVLKVNPEITIIIKKDLTQSGLINYFYLILILLVLAFVTRKTYLTLNNKK